MFASKLSKAQTKPAALLRPLHRLSVRSDESDRDKTDVADATNAGATTGVAAGSFGEIPILPPSEPRGRGTRGSARPGVIQPKLVIGAATDPLEHEADRAADAAMLLGGSPRVSSPPAALSRKCASCGGKTREERPLRAKSAGGVQTGQSVPPSVHAVLAQPGQTVEPGARAFLGPSFGSSFGDVRIHDGGDAATSAAEVGAKAYTVGRNIVFGAGQYRPATREGRWLLAHEMAHVLQQGAAGVRLQRYEAGEHAQMGDTKDALKGVIAESFKKYTVAVEDYLDTIAVAQSTTVSDLRDANSTKLKDIPVVQHPGPDKGAYMLLPAKTSKDPPNGKRAWLLNRTKVEIRSRGTEWHDIKVLSGKQRGTEGMIMPKYLTTEPGFEIGTNIRIPSFATAEVEQAYKGKAPKINPHGVELDYGTGVAMGGDLYGTPQEMDSAAEDELKDIDALVKRDQTAAKVSDSEWQTATKGRYTALAEKNEAHFAPQNAAIAPESAAGKTAPNHKSEWEKHHRTALDTSKAGDVKKALTVNAFGDHFLTDAFAAGHLINKRDVMEQFKGQLKLAKGGKDFTKESKAFFDAIAKDAFQGDVKTEFSKYETVKTFYRIHANIDSVSRFSQLLQAVHQEEPDLLASAVAKGVHDELNTTSGGIPAQSPKGGKWQLSGDKTLNEDTKRIGQRAVAQSQVNVLSVRSITTAIDYSAKFKAVWDYVPEPTSAGLATVVDDVKKGTDVKSGDLKKALVDLIKANYVLIIAELVKRNKLRKA